MGWLKLTYMVFGNMVMEWVVMVQFFVIIEVLFLVLVLGAFSSNLEMSSSVAAKVMAGIYCGHSTSLD